MGKGQGRVENIGKRERKMEIRHVQAHRAGSQEGPLFI